MSGVIVTPGRDPWMVANWAYRILLRRVSEALDDEADRFAVWQAEIFQTLNFERLEPSQRTRPARSVAGGAEALCPELLRSDDRLDHLFAAALVELALILREDYA